MLSRGLNIFFGNFFIVPFGNFRPLDKPMKGVHIIIVQNQRHIGRKAFYLQSFFNKMVGHIFVKIFQENIIQKNIWVSLVKKG